MNFKRILAAALSAVTILSATSCGFIVVNDVSGRQTGKSGEAEGDDSPETAVKVTEFTKYRTREDAKAISDGYLDELPARDYEGAVFFLTTPDASYIAPDDTESVLSRLAVQRNAEIEERYNISLLTAVEDGDTMFNALVQEIAAGSFYTDLLMIPLFQVGEYKMANVLLNMRSAPFFDLDQPYFNAESSDMTSGGYTTYGVAGDASISPSDLSAVYMNKAILAEAGVDAYSFFRMTGEGTWTWDRLLEAAEAVASLGDCTTISAESLDSRLPDLVFKSMGNQFVLAGERKVPIVGFSLHGVQPTMDVLERIYSDSHSAVRDASDAIVSFAEGKTAFHIEYLYAMPWLTNAAADWGLLPLPKASEDQEEYKTLVDNDTLIFAIPKNHTNAEIPAIILSALNAASSGYMYDAFVDYNMLNILRDNDSVNMLDLILDTASFDFALAFGTSYPTIANATYRLIRSCAPTNNLAESYSARRQEANKVMRQYFDLTY